ncbi:hypothetical protein [Cupriavidus pinatubonensis]|uniref:hypothetical protein n=1 Tax=Cupriavidus pinatubonensis TaxID=248026 RepID=UPI001CC3A5B9|nr:hypothetical protein [Cupriavidus pinatubonensis]
MAFDRVLAVGVICLLASLAQSANARPSENIRSCPASAPTEGIFSAAKIYKNAVVAVEEGDEVSPIHIALYRSNGNSCKKTIIARYSHEGADPKVDSVFFGKINGQENLFTIVRWEVNHRGIGTYGNLYQVYAYKRVAETLVENDAITKNGYMTGLDGYQDGSPVIFPYKTAASVKKFFKIK